MYSGYRPHQTHKHPALISRAAPKPAVKVQDAAPDTEREPATMRKAPAVKSAKPNASAALLQQLTDIVVLHAEDIAREALTRALDGQISKIAKRYPAVAKLIKRS